MAHCHRRRSVEASDRQRAQKAGKSDYRTAQTEVHEMTKPAAVIAAEEMLSVSTARRWILRKVVRKHCCWSLGKAF